MQGQHPRFVYFVKAGLVSLSSSTPDGAELVLMLRGPASILCSEAMRGQPSPWEVRALSRVRLCGLSGEEMKRWIGPERSPARALLDLLLDENQLRHTEERLREGNCLGRVARFTLTFEGFLTERPDALRKQVLARLLRMRPETLSRCLTRLERCGAIDATHGVRVQDQQILSSIVSSAKPSPLAASRLATARTRTPGLRTGPGSP